MSPVALQVALTLHILLAVVVAASAGAAFVVALQGRGVEPAVALNRAHQQMRLGRWLQWGLVGSVLTGAWLVPLVGFGVLLRPWLLLKLLLLVGVGAISGALQARTLKRRLLVLTEQASGDRHPSLAAEVTACNRRENLYFAIALPAILLLLLLGILKPF